MFKMKTTDGTEFTVEGEDTRGVLDHLNLLIDDHNLLTRVHEDVRSVKGDTERLLEGQGRIEAKLKKESDIGRRDRAAGRKEMKVLRKVIAEGGEPTFPWYRLKEPRMRQVEAVLACLREHTTFTVKQAAKKTFAKTYGGYPGYRALSAYCYSIRLGMYV